MSFSVFQSLKSIIKGDVYTDRVHRYLTATDGSIFCVEPACVTYPRDASDVSVIVRFANHYGITIHPRGAGSGVCGSALGSGICVDFTRYMNSMIDVDIHGQTVECDPGFRMGELDAALKGTGLFFPPDPSSGDFATFGGMVNTNASGAHSVKYGSVADYLEDADIVLSSGELIRLSDIEKTPHDRLPDPFQKLFRLYETHSEVIESSYPNIACNVCGYHLKQLVTCSSNSPDDRRLNLRRLFAGSEGTLGIVTRLKFRLIQKPAHDSLIIAYFDSLVSSVRAVQRILPMGPSGIEIMDKSLLNLARESDDQLKRHIPAGIDNVLMIEFDSNDQKECQEKIFQVCSLLKSSQYSSRFHTAVSAQEKQQFWAVRKAAVPILYRLKGTKKAIALIEDAAVPIDGLESFFEGLYDCFQKYKTPFVIYGHIAKGLLHTRPLLNLKAPDDLRLLKPLADDVFRLVHSLQGTVSGEHGDGRLRSGYIQQMYPHLYDIFQEVKQIFDPDCRFNPDIKTKGDPAAMTKNLRFGASYRRKLVVKKNLIWKEGFEDEAENCHGCSKCTTITSTTRMCPVYKATRNEIASPKAKANILRGIISGAISDREIFENNFRLVMDACIQCGSCYSECPSGVNIPKMVIEARSQYHLRFGNTTLNDTIASPEFTLKMISTLPSPFLNLLNAFIVPNAAAFFCGASSVSGVRFADHSLYNRIRFREGNGSQSVLYFPGCYAAYVRPEIGIAAVSILKKIGFTILTPPSHCCGLPALTKGSRDTAARSIQKNLRQWRHILKDVSHVAVSCSSCGLSLRREWQTVFSDRDIDTLEKKVIHISALVNQRSGKLRKSSSDRQAAYHLPCHLKIQPDADSSLNLLCFKNQLKVIDLKSLCCGMAGSWGLQKKHLSLSQTIASDLINKLNALEGVSAVTDCPSCELQIRRLTQKQVFHPLELIKG